MNIPVRLPGLEGQNLALCTAGTFAGPKLTLDGQPLPQRRGLFQLRSNGGSVLNIKLKGRLLDPIPDLEVGGQTITLVPPLQWYQYAWMSLPLLLLFLGGAIGGFCGGLAATLSSRVFRSDLSENMQYAASAFISSAACVTYLLIATTLFAAGR
jgi:hypothetical protein